MGTFPVETKGGYSIRRWITFDEYLALDLEIVGRSSSRLLIVQENFGCAPVMHQGQPVRFF
jgi:hypothetical protein